MDSPTPVLEYGELSPRTSTLTLMRRWQAAAVGCLIGTVAVSFLRQWIWITLALVAFALCTALMTLYLYRSGRTYIGKRYAVTYVVFTLLSMPFALFGLWAVPGLVESDIEKWQRRRC